MKTPTQKPTAKPSKTKGSGHKGKSAAKVQKMAKGTPGQAKSDNSSRVMKQTTPKAVKESHDHSSNQGHAFGRFRMGIVKR